MYVQYNDDLTVLDVTFSVDEIEGNDRYAIVGFYYGLGYYQAFLGEQKPVEIHYYNLNGELLQSWYSEVEKTS